MIGAIGLAFSKFGSWVANNPAVQWVLGALGVLFALFLWGERREGQGRKQERVKQKERDLDLRERAGESAREIIAEEKRDADAALDAGRRASVAEPSPVERMSDAEFRLTFGYDRKAGDPGYRP